MAAYLLNLMAGRTNSSIRNPLQWALLATLLLMPIIGNAYKVGHGYMVHGGIGCSSYLAQYQNNLQNRIGDDMVTMEFSQTHGWIKGYLTAYNAWAKNDLLDASKGRDTDGIERWLASYCNENLEDDLPDALKAFVSQAAQNMSRPMPDRGI